jgi:hypothetical protein
MHGGTNPIRARRQAKRLRAEGEPDGMALWRKVKEQVEALRTEDLSGFLGRCVPHMKVKWRGFIISD